MKKDITKEIEKSFELAKAQEKLRSEILKNEIIPQELKDGLIKLKEKFEQQRIDDEKFIEDNKHRKIIGYDSSFMPIYE